MTGAEATAAATQTAALPAIAPVTPAPVLAATPLPVVTSPASFQIIKKKPPPPAVFAKKLASAKVTPPQALVTTTPAPVA